MNKTIALKEAIEIISNAVALDEISHCLEYEDMYVFMYKPSKGITGLFFPAVTKKGKFIWYDISLNPFAYHKAKRLELD